MLFHRRSLALVGLLIALLTTLAIQPATAAAQSISYSSGPRNLISDGGFEPEQSAWTRRCRNSTLDIELAQAV